MIRYGEANPLNVFGLRQVVTDRCPPHFTKVDLIPLRIAEDRLLNWVYENLSGRFFISQFQREANVYFIAFEISSDATQLILCADQLQDYLN